VYHNTIAPQVFQKFVACLFYPFLGVQILEKYSLNLKIKITRKSTCVHIGNNIRKYKFKPHLPTLAGPTPKTIFKFQWQKMD
jgi:hypothetical protein